MPMKSFVLSITLSLISCLSLAEDVEHVSMLRVIANPESLVGKTIMVKGYLRYENETQVLFYDANTYKDWRTKEGVWLSFSKLKPKSDVLSKLNGYSVVVYGKVNPTFNGHKNCCSGSIEVTHIEQSVNGI